MRQLDSMLGAGNWMRRSVTKHFHKASYWRHGQQASTDIWENVWLVENQLIQMPSSYESPNKNFHKKIKRNRENVDCYTQTQT